MYNAPFPVYQQHCATITKPKSRTFPATQRHPIVRHPLAVALVPCPTPITPVPGNHPSMQCFHSFADSESRMNGIRQYAILCDWLLSFSKMFSRCIRVQLVPVLATYLLLNNIPLHGYISNFLSPFIQWWTYCLFVLGVITNNVLNSLVQLLAWTYVTRSHFSRVHTCKWNC